RLKVPDPEAFAIAWKIATVCRSDSIPIDENALLDRAADLMRMGALCSDEILANPHRLQAWVEEASRNPAIRAREEEAADLSRQDRITPSLKSYDRSDLGNSDRFVRRYGHDMRYCHPQKTWYIWDLTRWKRDEAGKIVDLAKKTIRYIGDEAGLIDGETERAAMWKWAAASQNHSRISGLVSLAQSSVPILPEHLDANPHLLNFPNGTLDLTTFSFRDHHREDFCSKVMGTTYDPAATCPLWQDHLRTVFAGDETFIHSFQLMCGYSLLADNPEQVLFVLHGSGKNGKSVTVGALRKIWGDYSWNMAADTLMARRYADPTTARSDLAALRGVRLGTASESDGGTRLGEATVKLLTGGDDMMTVRKQYESEFSFKPGVKIWLITNRLPTIRGTDEAIWRRIWLIPFTVTIPEEKRDPRMGVRLREEASGILNWCLAGLKEYLHDGRLVKPEIVSQATDAYREDQDLLGDFLSDRCEIGSGYQCTAKDLYQAYTQWCAFNDEKLLKQRSFGITMGERFKKTKGRSVWTYHGVKVREQSNISGNSQNEPGSGLESWVPDKPYFPKVSHEKKIEKSLGNSNNPAPSGTEPISSRSDLIKEYDLPPDPDLSSHIRFTKKGEICICKGCGQTAMWHGQDHVRPLPLCDSHYKELTGGDPP
ncbi:MAG: phage/plasmid primase, P4 family, partial [Methanolinea sp.]